ncbi:MAG: DUF3604 domain-containing protein [Deltaproteobacteria bacterium]|nr:DUF3604 domain-containing protein [Deltaproteobacteria bacterium]
MRALHSLPLLLASLSLVGCPSTSEEPPTPAPPAEVPCAEQTPERRALFGDLHVHTRWSFDAYVQDVRVTPAEALAFAQGAPVRLPPLDENGVGTREVRLERPLDFVALTDHAEYLAEMAACVDPSSPAFDAEPCVAMRAGDVSATYAWGGNLTEEAPERFPSICGAVDCEGLARDGWQRTIDEAEAADDATDACTFTAFVGYEYSCSTNVSNAHRNVVFRNGAVPALPTTCFEETDPWALWRALARDCRDAPPQDGVQCDVLAIPHNSNWSNGNMFVVEYPFAAEGEGALAEFRAEMEPLVEIYQHKGDSECSPGFTNPLGAPDEQCAFEKLRAEPIQDCGEGTGAGAMAGLGCVSRRDFVRDVLVEGLLEEERIGANPYRLGIIASTDTHNGTPGLVDEASFPGHTGREEGSPQARLQPPPLIPGGVLMSGGGLAGVYATENSRDSIFDAMQRREAFGTSGPRIQPRLFGGFGLGEGLCEDPAMLERAYEGGVPMGGELTSTEAPLRFLAAALADPGTKQNPGSSLQRLQIVKGWVDGDGGHTEVIDVAGDLSGGVDPDTCEPTEPDAGADSLCAVWTDPTWEPGQRAVYYLRVLEVPTCRWSAHQCNALPAADRPASCSDPAIPRTVQERAWTSPIWVAP